MAAARAFFLLVIFIDLLFVIHVLVLRLAAARTHRVPGSLMGPMPAFSSSMAFMAKALVMPAVCLSVLCPGGSALCSVFFSLLCLERFPTYCNAMRRRRCVTFASRFSRP
jgi:hypothetical protein